MINTERLGDLTGTQPRLWILVPLTVHKVI